MTRGHNESVACRYLVIRRACGRAARRLATRCARCLATRRSRGAAGRPIH